VLASTIRECAFILIDAVLFGIIDFVTSGTRADIRSIKVLTGVATSTVINQTFIDILAFELCVSFKSRAAIATVPSHSIRAVARVQVTFIRLGCAFVDIFTSKFVSSQFKPTVTGTHVTAIGVCATVLASTIREFAFILIDAILFGIIDFVTSGTRADIRSIKVLTGVATSTVINQTFIDIFAFELCFSFKSRAAIAIVPSHSIRAVARVQVTSMRVGCAFVDICSPGRCDTEQENVLS